MKKIAVMLAQGFEELEAITAIDILRRAGLDTSVIGLNSQVIKGAHDIKIECDKVFDEKDCHTYDGIILPGGDEGANNLANSNGIKDILNQFIDQKKLIAAICASPALILAKHKILPKKATCYPTYKEALGNNYEEKPVVISDTFITAQGPGSAHLFAFAIIDYLLGQEKSTPLKAGMLF